MWWNVLAFVFWIDVILISMVFIPMILNVL